MRSFLNSTVRGLLVLGSFLLVTSELRAEGLKEAGLAAAEKAMDGGNRHEEHKSTYLGFGASNFSNLNNTSVGFSLGVAYSWAIDQFRIKVLGEGDIAGSALFVNAGLGGSYCLTRTDFAPYLSADFGGGIGKADGGSLTSGSLVGGFILGLGAGVEMLHSAAVSLDLGFRAAFLLNSNTYGMPQALSLRLGIYF